MVKIDSLLNNCISSSEIYIYGDGEVGRLTRVYLQENGIEIKAFLTSNEPINSVVLGASVHKIDEIELYDNQLIIICMHKMWWNSVSKMLIDKDFTNFFIVDDSIRIEMENAVEYAEEYDEINKKINVLLYHRVQNDIGPYTIVVNERNFENQLAYISQTYNILNCNEEWDNVSRTSVALTFDDGYGDFFLKAYPLLKKYSIPATVFIATAGIDNNNEFWWDKLEQIIGHNKLPEFLSTSGHKYCVKDYNDRKELINVIRDDVIDNTYKDRDAEIKKLIAQVDDSLPDRIANRTMSKTEIELLAKDPLITIGAHTVNHILCDKEDFGIQYNEIKESKEQLESIINCDVNLFAYPNGNIGDRTREILEQLKFSRAFTCEHACIDFIDRKYDIPRNPVLNWDKKDLNRKFRGMWFTSKL